MAPPRRKKPTATTSTPRPRKPKAAPRAAAPDEGESDDGKGGTVLQIRVTGEELAALDARVIEVQRDPAQLGRITRSDVVRAILRGALSPALPPRGGEP